MVEVVREEPAVQVDLRESISLTVQVVRLHLSLILLLVSSDDEVARWVRGESSSVIHKGSRLVRALHLSSFMVSSASLFLEIGCAEWKSLFVVRKSFFASPMLK